MLSYLIVIITYLNNYKLKFKCFLMNLLDLIKQEGSRNNILRSALEEGRFPSEEVAREIGSEELYRIASDLVKFRFVASLEILKSNYHFTRLCEAYIEENKGVDKAPELDLDELRNFIKRYNRDTINTTKLLAEQCTAGYEASW